MIRKRPQYKKAIRVVDNFTKAPPSFVEYAYYASIAYALFGEAWGLVVPLLGIGMLALLAAFCLMRLGSRATALYAPIAYPLGCAISFILLQLTVHGESFMGGETREFVTWILALIVVHSLSFRQGFLHRFALAAFLIGLCSVPYLRFSTDTRELTRAGVEVGIGLANPNSLAMWFGFCSVYFIIAGIEARGNGMRAAFWLIAFGCLYIVGITVSRGPLLGVAIATTLALRRLLKRGFVPILVLLIVSWVIFASGLFGKIADFYTVRGAEDTGRSFLWSVSLERFLNAPLAGVGVSNAKIRLQSGHSVNPHNGFLYLAQASGVVPFAFFLAYWIRAARGAFHARVNRLSDASFQPPLFIFAFLEMMTLGTAFMSPWHIAVLSTAVVRASGRASQMATRRVGKVWKSGYQRYAGGTAYALIRHHLRGHPSRSA